VLASMTLDGSDVVEIYREGLGERFMDSFDEKRFVVDEHHVYFFNGHTNFTGYTAARVPKAGGTAQALGKALPKSQRGEGLPEGDLALGADHVYWTYPGGGTVMRVRKDGSCPVETIAAGRQEPDWLHVRGGAIYWLERAAAPPRIIRMDE